MQAYSDQWKLIQQVLHDHIDRDDLKFTNHANERMEERRISKESVQYMLYHNPPSEMHQPLTYPYGEQPFTNLDPVFTVVGVWGNKKIAVALSIRQYKRELVFCVITTFEVERGRHK